jgi:hypothetical protein
VVVMVILRLSLLLSVLLLLISVLFSSIAILLHLPFKWFLSLHRPR